MNDGTGRFLDVTVERAPHLAETGMVTDALFMDRDADGDLDHGDLGRMDAHCVAPQRRRDFFAMVRYDRS